MTHQKRLRLAVPIALTAFLAVSLLVDPEIVEGAIFDAVEHLRAGGHRDEALRDALRREIETNASEQTRLVDAIVGGADVSAGTAGGWQLRMPASRSCGQRPKLFRAGGAGRRVSKVSGVLCCLCHHNGPTESGAASPGAVSNATCLTGSFDSAHRNFSVLRPGLSRFSGYSLY